MDTDLRYAHVTCADCGQRFQIIDYRCASHAVTCPNAPTLTVEQLRAAAAEEGANVDIEAGAHGPTITQRRD